MKFIKIFVLSALLYLGMHSILLASLTHAQGGIGESVDYGEIIDTFSNTRNLDSFNIQGPIRQVTLEEANFVPDITGNYTEGEKQIVEIDYFDANGLQTNSEAYNLGELIEKSTFQHNEQQNIELILTYDPQDNLIRRTVFTYLDGQLAKEEVFDANDVLIEWQEYTRNGNQTEVKNYTAAEGLESRQVIISHEESTEIIMYDDEDNMTGRFIRTVDDDNTIQIEIYDENNVLFMTQTSIVNQQGLVTETTTYQIEQDMETTQKYEYENFDSYDNWRKKTTTSIVEIDVPMPIPIPGLGETPVSVQYRTFSTTANPVSDYLMF